MLRTLIVEDEFTSRMILNTLLLKLGRCDVAVNGEEAVAAFTAALQHGPRYDLVCLDITMPCMDGHAVLKEIRALEKSAQLDDARRVKVIMTTASQAQQDITGAHNLMCDAYLFKPIERTALLATFSRLGLTDDDGHLLRDHHLG